jgi:hypothetical protein
VNDSRLSARAAHRHHGHADPTSDDCFRYALALCLLEISARDFGKKFRREISADSGLGGLG